MCLIWCDVPVLECCVSFPPDVTIPMSSRKHCLVSLGLLFLVVSSIFSPRPLCARPQVCLLLWPCASSKVFFFFPPSLNKIVAGFSLLGEGFTAGTCFLHLLIMTLTVVSWTLYQGFGNLCRLSWHICSRIYGVIDTLVVHIEAFFCHNFFITRQMAFISC